MACIAGAAFFTAIIAGLIYYLFFKKDGKNYPEGPWALPIIGNGLQLGDKMEVKMAEWAKIYGDVYQIFLGRTRGVIVTDLKLAKEIFNDPAFGGRVDHEIPNLFSEGLGYGILNSFGKVWMEQRRFTLRHLRDFGFGKKQSEDLIVNEITEFLDKYAKTQGQSVILNKTFQMAVLNTLWQMMTGTRYEQDDPRLWSVFNQNVELNDILEKNKAALVVPAIAKMIPNISGWNKIVRLVQSMFAIVHSHIDEHRKHPAEDGVPRDFIDSYIKEIESTTDPESSFYKNVGNKNLGVVINDLFQAGFETVTQTLSSATLYLVKYPEVQDKFRAELDKVVGRNRLPALSDRTSLPYVEATIAEVMRIATLVPTGMFHSTLEDTKIRDYDIPKDTLICCPLSFFHNDEQYFPNPREFKPERFLSEDGRKFVKHEALVPFSFGKRACLGETLARDEVFLFLTHMFHRFTLRLSPENPDPSMVNTGGFVRGPKDFKVVMTERN